MDQLVKVFTGSEISIELLRSRLEELGISGIIRNDFKSGISAGFGGGTPAMVDFYIEEKNVEQAQPIIQNFQKED
ncbi:DUF2007 domain-containing protein [bacterium]|nr:DUF2007 domain-containing protein [bacterium]